jgi:outer membrane receptor protein involved in Fe transport
VPAGVYTLRAQFIGYQPSEVRNVRVLADQTLTVNFTMARAVELGAITVTVQQNPIVPRDQVTSKSIITGNLVNELPVDNVRDVLSLQPGVVESGKGEGLSLRGGRPGEAVVMVDGAPVRSALTGADRLTVGTNALEEASITTGAIGAEFGDAQSGIISYVTKSGGPKLNGSIAYQTDEPFGNGMSVGFNTVEASLGGPIAGNLTFFLSGQLFGQQSSFQGKGFETTPTWVLGGLDTTVTVATSPLRLELEPRIAGQAPVHVREWLSGFPYRSLQPDPEPELEWRLRLPAEQRHAELEQCGHAQLDAAGRAECGAGARLRREPVVSE